MNFGCFQKQSIDIISCHSNLCDCMRLYESGWTVSPICCEIFTSLSWNDLAENRQGILQRMPQMSWFTRVKYGNVYIAHKGSLISIVTPREVRIPAWSFNYDETMLKPC